MWSSKPEIKKLLYVDDGGGAGLSNTSLPQKELQTKENSDGSSLPASINSDRFDTTLVSSWRSPEDAISWAQSIGITVDQLTNTRWLNQQRAGRLGEEGGLGRSFAPLYNAILSDPRFEGSFFKFKKWLKPETTPSFGALVTSWKKPEDAIAWITSKGGNLDQLANTTWLLKIAPQPPEKGGIGMPLAGLSQAIAKDPRFKAGFRSFQSWLGLEKSESYTSLVASWKTPTDALAWAQSKGISPEQLANCSWLAERAKLPKERGGIGLNLAGLEAAIRAHGRFGKSFPKFAIWLGLAPKLDFQDIVKSWKTPKDALNWANSRGISGEQLGNSAWLNETSKKSVNEGGIGESLIGLYESIKRDPRFKRDFSRFQTWLGLRSRDHYKRLLESWQSSEDALRWAKQKGITPEQLGNSSWLNSAAKQSRVDGGIGESLTPLFNAINRDRRFKGEWLTFRSWLGLKEREDYRALIASWDSPADAIHWAESKNITVEQLTSYAWLTRTAKLPVAQGGIGCALYGFLAAVTKDPRFWNDFDLFRSWLGLQVTTDFEKLLESWKTPKDVIDWTTSKGISLRQLTSAKWLCITSGLPIGKGGIGESCKGLYYRIKSDERFPQGLRCFAKWLGLEWKVTFKELVASWKEPADALAWMHSKGIGLHQFTDTNWLSRIAKRPRDEGGIGESMVGLLAAITKDPRFDKKITTFRTWLGVSPRLQFRAIVSNWKRPEDAINWGKAHLIQPEQLANWGWLKKHSSPGDEHGNGRQSYTGLTYAITTDPRFPRWSDFKEWLGVSSPTLTDTLREIFSTPEAAALEALAQALGAHAAAEFIAVKYQDKFINYGTELIDNLSRYLGEFESSYLPALPSLPTELFVLTDLTKLRRALFNLYRDAYQPLFSRSLALVKKELTKISNQSQAPEHKAFIQELITYFTNVEGLPHPTRLKRTISGSKDFPAKHQKIAMFETLEERAVLLGDEMGGGKTGSAIGLTELLRDLNGDTRALIVAPAKVISVWQKALRDDAVGYFRSGSAPNITCLRGPNKDWDKAREAQYVLISLESLRHTTNKVPNVTLCKELEPDILIFDEAHNAKNLKQYKRNLSDTERVFEVAKARSIQEGYLMILSGTPIPNTLKDLASQLRLLYHGREQGNEGIVDYSDLSSLSKTLLNSPPLLVRNLLVRKMIRRRTEDCLPVGCELSKEVVTLQLNPVEQARYDSIVEDPFYTSTEKIKALRKLLLSTESKFQGIKRAVNEALGNEKYKSAGVFPKVVLAESMYAKGISRNSADERVAEAAGEETYLLSRLQNEFGDKVKIFVLDGKNSTQATQILKEFAEHQGAAVLLTLVSVSGEGLNITCAADGILISPVYTVSAEEQFLRRMYRSGQKIRVDFKVLSFKNTIEDGIIGYAQRKHRVVQGLIDGRPLTKREEAILNSDFSAVNEGGVIAYETMTPRQQALWILAKLKGRGRAAIRDFLFADQGKYAIDFANGYPQDEETSYSGNTARLVTSVIRSLIRSEKISVADIACGCRTLERIFEGDANVAVSSLDINEVALEVGASLLRSPKVSEPIEIGTMDQLPYKNSSHDIAVLSLALDMTHHGSKRSDGDERIRVLSELSRIVKKGGHAIITLQRGLFPSEESFFRFVEGIEKHFGFKRVSDRTGLATAFNDDKREKYEGWVVTLTKVEDLSTPRKITRELISVLRFPRVSRTSGRDGGFKQRPTVAQESIGAYQDKFSIEGKGSLHYRPTTMHQTILEASRLKVEVGEKRISSRVMQLKEEFGSIEAIPEELLLSISPLALSNEGQSIRDEYFRGLISKYGSVDAVPIEKITGESEVILIRGSSKRRGGSYLTLAKLSEETGKYGGFKTRYFQ